MAKAAGTTAQPGWALPKKSSYSKPWP
ncbi:hypothetical protein R2601_04243 [Salipiger bermudensis HTCC2601]|uniref:Uncharacterized protein n=1 Tax=Salipiger bermudensis (strain DSM 26914 / JCM 13377 / KCTC 12554 / HTCC2601) TaxID=314265 RepID=Q0FVZ7_SALBH|nr:hypothetical protein R2601_04243 [Salipiger bermudensis HTCC2601]